MNEYENILLLQQIVENYGTDESVARLLDKYDFHVLPVMNPDGYVYGWDVVRYFYY